MNPMQMAKTAYSPTQFATRTPRGTEFAAFERITARLARADKPEASLAQRATALHENRQLWTLLAADVADQDNALPQSLRAQIFYLAEFTMLHSRKVLNDGEAIAPLIDINTAVMRGLRGEANAA